ncbi:MAG: hypothetical protein V1757_00120 [Actinomycetota bacterium]
MADDPLRDLLSSPLETTPRRGGGEQHQPRPPRGGGQGPWVVASIIVGALAFLGGYVVVGGEEAPPTTTAASTTTTTTMVAAPIGLLPDGYTALGDRLGVKVERILVRTDAVFVSLSSVVPNTLAPEESSGFQGGLWTLVLADGRRIGSVQESSDASAPGFFSVQFPPDGYSAADITGIALQAVAHRSAEDISAEIETPFTIPADGTPITATLAQSTFFLDAGVNLVFSDVTLTASRGEMSWTVEGPDEDAGAIVYPYLELEMEDGTIEVAEVRTDDPTFGFFFAQSVSTRPTVRAGSILYDPIDPGPTATFPTDVPLRARFFASVSWAVYSPDTVMIPIGEDVVVTEVG